MFLPIFGCLSPEVLEWALTVSGDILTWTAQNIVWST